MEGAMDTMLMALADAAKKPVAATWRAEIGRILLTVLSVLTLLGLSL